MNQFRGESTFTTWLYRLAINKFHDDWQKTQTRNRAYQQWGENSPKSHNPNDETQERTRWLAKVMNDLSPDLRVTAVLIVAEGFDQAEAAKILEIPVGTVSWRMSEIKKKLRARAHKEGLIYE